MNNVSNEESASKPITSGTGDGEGESPKKRNASQAGIQPGTPESTADDTLGHDGDGEEDGNAQESAGMILSDGGYLMPSNDTNGSSAEK